MPEYRWKGISKYDPKELFTNNIAKSEGVTVINLDTVRKGVALLMKYNVLPDREIVLPDYITPKMIREAIKILEKSIKCEKPRYVEVENPIESGDPLEYSNTDNPLYRDSVGGKEMGE